MADVVQLQREVNDELQYIAVALEQRAEKFVPQGTQIKEVKERLDELKQRVDEKQQILDSLMEEAERSAQSLKESSLLNNSDQVGNFKFVLEALCEIENNLLTLNMNCPAPIEEAKLLMEANEWLKALFQEGKSQFIVERIRNLLHKDVVYSTSFLLTKLNQECKELISFPSGGVKGYNVMKIRVKNIISTSEALEALDIMKEFKTKVNKWSEKIFTDFCSVIINSRTGVDCLDYKCSTNDDHLFTVSHKINSEPVDVSGVFKTLSVFFESLHKAIGNIELGTDCRPLTLYIGRALEESLMSLLLKNCISLSTSMVDKNEPHFVEVMKLGSDFRKLMIELKFWNQSAPKFLAYAEANDTVFINRRCFDILTNAKKLIMEPFIELTTVGTDEEIHEELINDYTTVFDTPLNIRDIARDDAAYPKFMQLQRCKVSNSALEIVKLLENTISEAVTAENEFLKARLLTTAQNILRLYNSICVKHHSTTITSVPQAAGIFYNNSYYICHRLILMPFFVIQKFGEVRDMQEDVYPIVVDNIWLLREAATNALEEMLANTRRQLSTLLVNRQLFVGLNDSAKMRECKKTITACYLQICSIRDNWKEIMAETVFCKSLGNIVSFFISDLADMFFELEDIRSSDADASAMILNETLTQLQNLFIINGKTTIHNFCEHAYFRIKEIIFCLNGSLQGISDRWCDRKGPLAQWLTASEVKLLIKALFQNTQQRKSLLESIV